MKSPSVAPLRTRDERDRLVEQYLPLVRHIVARMPVVMPATLSREDFYSVGVMGLLHAAASYDVTRGASFKTFAYTAIRGAILDEIRKHDPVPRSRRDRLRRMERAADQLRSSLQRAPNLEELAEHLGTTVDSLDGDLLALHTYRMLSLDDEFFRREGETAGIHPGTPRDAGPDPAHSAITKEQIRLLAKAISELPEAERHTVVLYHYENLYLKEIGEILGVSESRVSQILARATARLRLRMKED